MGQALLRSESGLNWITGEFLIRYKGISNLLSDFDNQTELGHNRIMQYLLWPFL